MKLAPKPSGGVSSTSRGKSLREAYGPDASSRSVQKGNEKSLSVNPPAQVVDTPEAKAGTNTSFQSELPLTKIYTPPDTISRTPKEKSELSALGTVMASLRNIRLQTTDPDVIAGYEKIRPYNERKGREGAEEGDENHASTAIFYKVTPTALQEKADNMVRLSGQDDLYRFNSIMVGLLYEKGIIE